MISGAYIPGTSVLHKTDPRVKTVMLLFFSVILFFQISITSLTAILLLLSGMIILNIGFSRILHPIKMILPLLLFIFILTPPFYRTGEVLLSFRDIIILTDSGLIQTLRLVMRFTGITFSFYLFFSTTTMDEFILTLRWFRLPHRSALIITISLRYIPFMITLYNNIKDAHKLRTDSPARRRIGNKFYSVFPVLVSVLIQSIKSIPTLSMSLELKGIGLKNKRTQYQNIESRTSILLQIPSAIAIVALIILIAVSI